MLKCWGLDKSDRFCRVHFRFMKLIALLFKWRWNLFPISHCNINPALLQIMDLRQPATTIWATYRIVHVCKYVSLGAVSPSTITSAKYVNSNLIFDTNSKSGQWISTNRRRAKTCNNGEHIKAYPSNFSIPPPLYCHVYANRNTSGSIHLGRGKFYDICRHKV